MDIRPESGTGFENPGYAGHMCPSTLDIRQPHVAGTKAKLNLNCWGVAQRVMLPKELVGPAILEKKAIYLKSTRLLSRH